MEFFGLLLVLALLALVGHAAASSAPDTANDEDEDLETWLVSPGLVPHLPDYSDDK